MPHVQSHEPYISEPWPPPPSASTPIIIQLPAPIDRSPHHHLCLPQRFRSPSSSPSRHPFPASIPPVPHQATTDDDEGIARPPRPGPREPPDMSHRLGRVVSDLTHSNSRGATPHQQSTTSGNTDAAGNVGKQAKQKLTLLFSGVVSWRRSESSAEAGISKAKNSKQQQQTTRGGGGGTGGARRRGIDIVLVVRKYVSMVEQLIASYSGGSSRDGDGRRRSRPHTFTYGRGGGGGGGAASSRRHKGRLSSAPASLRGSPANSGHLSVGESVTKTPSEVSTMEELQSAIQAAIAHCKSSAAAAGGDEQRRKC